MELTLSWKNFQEEMNLTGPQMLAAQTRTQSESQVLANLHNTLFPHIERRGDDTGGFFRRKAYFLGELTRMAMDVAMGKPKSDREHVKFKRMDTAGDLYFQQFKRTFREVLRSMLKLLDTRMTFEASIYAGEKIRNLIQPETFGAYWNAREFLKQYEKAHKAQWGGKDGISQELSRLSFYSTVSMLRRVSLQMNAELNIAEPRRLHASQ